MKKISIAALSLISLFAITQVSFAATYTVTTTDDEMDGSADCITNPLDCSLREAITGANATAGNDTIVLSDGPYLLDLTGTDENSNATGDLDITDTVGTLTIQAADGAAPVIDGNNTDRILHTFGNTRATITGVTFQDGQLNGVDVQGGAIYNNGRLTLMSCTITGTQAGASNNIIGGAIYNAGTFVTYETSIVNTTANGVAIIGGAIHNFTTGSITMDNSLIANNTASSDSGPAVGVAIYNMNEVSIANSTISDNIGSSNTSDTMGTFYNSGTAIMEFITISNNIIAGSGGSLGGGFYQNSGTATLKNSIISDNSSDSANDCAGASEQTITSDDYNIISDTTGCTSFYTSASNDQLDVSPMLDNNGLVDNGGETDTIALQTSPTVSPAINKIPQAECTDIDGDPLTSDQRTESRTGYCDIGAYEHQDATAPVITVTNDTAAYNNITVDTAYTDQGATALDDIDGDLTSSISADTSAVIITVIGSYTVTYSVTDLTGNTGTATRTVNVVTAEQEADDDESGAPDEYEEIDPTSEEEVAASISKVVGLKKGKIKVTYSNDLAYTYTVFNNNSTKKKTKVKQYQDTAYYVVTQGLGKKIAIVNVLNGEVQKRKKLSPKKKYQSNGLKILQLRKKYYAVVTSKNKKNKVRVIAAKINITKLKFAKKKITATTNNSKVKVSKTVKKKNNLLLKNSKGKKLVKYLFTKKNKLKVVE